ncbi:glycosyltransferase family 2 protein [Agrobacterium larrymoorei]|uniref:glycosyltransferase family 2 protein n=1 Tax=Agrobacterium larrymoorei TaxID=160699 RepID=UPI0015721D16|nr:glycosyltransferase [Agrobacterium larrymoorei]NTJ43882.1 glycosyltransferase family 2 protein [Agrobacterium larrymoorei]
MDSCQSLAPGKPTTSIVICCYSEKRWDILKKAIRSAVQQSCPADEVVVIVDHNPSLALRLKGERLDGQVSIFENTNQAGLSGARNSGISLSAGELILFLDDDAVADRDLLATFVKKMENPLTLGAVSSIRPLWETKRPGWFPEEFLWTLGCTYRGMSPGRVRNLIGASMCIRRRVFDLAGGFDTGLGRTAKALPLGCEETELCIRAQKILPHGHFLFEPATGCDHAIPASRATWTYFLKRCWAEGLSKASLSLIASPGSALESERAYVRKTLPEGVIRNLGDLLRGKPSGALRAAAIFAGLAVTAAGFALGRVRAARARSTITTPVLEPGE